VLGHQPLHLTARDQLAGAPERQVIRRIEQLSTGNGALYEFELGAWVSDRRGGVVRGV
jgi:hypothetical protein